MPRNGLPCGVTPRPFSCRTVCGISPSPHALSTTPATTLDDDDLESGAGAVHRGGQPRRPAARDQQIDHRRLASAAFSTLIRVVSSAAFSTVNVSAVIHAVCTSGSATPSSNHRDVVGVRHEPVRPAGRPATRR